MNAKDQTALLDTPARGRGSVPDAETPRRGAPAMRRDPVPDLAEEFSPRSRVSRRAAELNSFEEDGAPIQRSRGLKVKLRWRIPRSVVGRTVVCVLGFTGVGAVAYSMHLAQVALLRDSRLTIPSSQAVEITGNNHLTRAQLLSVFGDDVDRNLLSVPLAARRAELESLPWVEHAIVMRLLPNHVRVAITERIPVAFVRQGSSIGLVDAHGVLLDLSPELAADHAYSFPVVTGISATDPASVRMARMKLYLNFTGELDAGTEKISKKLSEVDLTDPEDVKALIPDNGTDVLVHFGDTDFLKRYERYIQNLPDWKTKYPKLASVDMRYEHDVVLEMAPGAAVPIAGAGAAEADDRMPKAATAAKKPVVAKKPAAKAPAKPKPTAQRDAPVTTAPPPGGHLQQAFDVKPKAKPAKAGPR